MRNEIKYLKREGGAGEEKRKEIAVAGSLGNSYTHINKQMALKKHTKGFHAPLSQHPHTSSNRMARIVVGKVDTIIPMSGHVTV